MSFKHELQIEEITVLQRKSYAEGRGYADTICIKIHGQPPYPNVDGIEPILELTVARGHGVDYVRNMFDYEPKVIQID